MRSGGCQGTRVSTAELIRGFHEVFEHDEPLHWFDTEMKDIHGIDIFAHPFDCHARHATIESGRRSLLLMRVDLSDADKQSVLSRFLVRRSKSLVPMQPPTSPTPRPIEPSRTRSSCRGPISIVFTTRP